tara:strand:+ start:229 stop:576 length:348 start_codon:yes stop_codon:yes gene_type:complete
MPDLKPREDRCFLRRWRLCRVVAGEDFPAHRRNTPVSVAVVPAGTAMVQASDVSADAITVRAKPFLSIFIGEIAARLWPFRNGLSRVLARGSPFKQIITGHCQEQDVFSLRNTQN